MKKLVIFSLVVFALVMTGCASNQIINSFMDREIPVSRHALILVEPNIAVNMIDGELQLKGSLVSPIMSKRILVIPGRHYFTVSWYTRSISGTTTTTSGNVGLSGDFLAGHIYQITAEINGNRILFKITEENDMSIWNSREIASVKPPRRGRTNNTVIFQRAAESSPTELEGTWSLTIPPSLAQAGVKEIKYTFTGSTYTFVSTTTAVIGMRGTITLNGNSLVASWMQTSYDLASWMNMSRPIETTYEYSFSPEGNLLLKLTRGRGFSAGVIGGLARKGETEVLVKQDNIVSPFEGRWRQEGSQSQISGVSYREFKGDTYRDEYSIVIDGQTIASYVDSGNFTYTSTTITLTPKSSTMNGNPRELPSSEPVTETWSRTNNMFGEPVLKIGTETYVP